MFIELHLQASSKVNEDLLSLHEFLIDLPPGPGVNKAEQCFRMWENSTHRCSIKPTGAALESNQCWLNTSYWWIYQPLAELPEAPGFVVGPYCQLSLRSSTRNPNPSLVLNHLLTTLITTSRLPTNRGFWGSHIPEPLRSTEARFTVELETLSWSSGQ